MKGIITVEQANLWDEKHGCKINLPRGARVLVLSKTWAIAEIANEWGDLRGDFRGLLPAYAVEIIE